MEKIVLIDPYYICDNSIDKEFSLGLLTIVGYAKKKVSKDYHIEYFMPENREDVPFNEWRKKLLSLLTSIHPNIIGCTTRCDTYPFTLDFLSRIKKVLPNTKIIIGGPQATHTDYETLRQFDAIDYVIRGEGEITFTELIQAITNNSKIDTVAGITYRNQSGEIVRTHDREYMKDLMTNPDYVSICKHKNNIYINRIEAGRGCPFNCIFCSLCKMWNAKYRLVNVDEIMQHMKELNKITGKTYFVFEHDNLLARKDEAEEFLVRLIEQKCKFTWSCSSRIDSISRIDLSLLKEAGCRGVFFGIETGSAKMQKVYRKNINVATVYQTLVKLNNEKIGFTLSFICGHPQETIYDIEDTLKLGIKCKTLNCCSNIQLHKLAPLAGSAFLNEIKDELVLIDDAISDQSEYMYYLEYKPLIKKYPELFSSFYSVPLFENSAELLEQIYSKGWIDIINLFPRTLFYLIENYIDLLILINECDMTLFLEKTKAIIDKNSDVYLSKIYSLELEIYKIHKNFYNKKIGIQEDAAFNITQRIVTSSIDVLEFNADTYNTEGTLNKEVDVRIWMDLQSKAIKYAVLHENQKKKYNLLMNKDVINSLNNETRNRLIREGFLTVYKLEG